MHLVRTNFPLIKIPFNWCSKRVLIGPYLKGSSGRSAKERENGQNNRYGANRRNYRPYTDRDRPSERRRLSIYPPSLEYDESQSEPHSFHRRYMHKLLLSILTCFRNLSFRSEINTNIGNDADKSIRGKQSVISSEDLSAKNSLFTDL